MRAGRPAASTGLSWSVADCGVLIARSQSHHVQPETWKYENAQLSIPVDVAHVSTAGRGRVRDERPIL